MTSVQRLQIELLVWGCAFCVIVTICMFLSDNFDKNKRKWLLRMQLSSAILLACDALAYRFRGYPGIVGTYMVYISNFIVFFASDVTLLFFHEYVCSYLFGKEQKENLLRVKICRYICFAGMAMVVISQFTGLYYYIDADNFYHRNNGYVISLLIAVAGMMIDLSLLIQYHKNIGRKIFVSTLSYIVLPVIAAAVQLFWYGLSFINLSIAVAMVIIYIAAISEQNKEMYQLLKRKTEIEQRLEIATTLNQCVKELSSDNDSDVAINNLLGIINDYFSADRSYIFELNHENDTLCNSYEYVKDGVIAQKDNLQKVPADVVKVWMENFKKNQTYYISDLEQEKGYETYNMLVEQEVNKLIAVPLWKDGNILGFLGVDNPTEHYDDGTLLASIQYFVTNSLLAKKQKEELQYLSYQDLLTNLYNRNKYMGVLEECEEEQLEHTGVAYIDLNGLKQVNDTQGHSAGDRLIVGAATVVREVFPMQSYRVGGDEFVIIANNIGEKEFYGKIEEVQKRMKQKQISISIGFLWKDRAESLKAMLKIVDKEMYKEKEEYHRQQNI